MWKIRSSPDRNLETSWAIFARVVTPSAGFLSSQIGLRSGLEFHSRSGPGQRISLGVHFFCTWAELFQLICITDKWIFKCKQFKYEVIKKTCFSTQRKMDIQGQYYSTIWQASHIVNSNIKIFNCNIRDIYINLFQYFR